MSTRISPREARREARLLARQESGPRKVYYQLRGSAPGATLTYTSTGGGSGQRDVAVVSGWRSQMVRLRPGDFAYMSLQNLASYGTVQCKIVESGPLGDRTIAPMSTASGAYAIASCNGTVR